MSTVLLATDGSEHAMRAAERAIELARTEEAALHVLCVVDERKFDETALSTSELATIEAENHGHDCVDTVMEMAAESGVSVEGATEHGVPHEVILAYADRVDADFIVVGEHGEHAAHFGGVGRKVDAMADREVIVVETEP